MTTPVDSVRFATRAEIPPCTTAVLMARGIEDWDWNCRKRGVSADVLQREQSRSVRNRIGEGGEEAAAAVVEAGERECGCDAVQCKRS